MASELAERITERLILCQDEPAESLKTCDVCLLVTSERLAEIIDEELQRPWCCKCNAPADDECDMAGHPYRFGARNS